MNNTEQNSQPALASEDRLGEVPSNARAVGSIHPNSLAAYRSTAADRASIEDCILELMNDGCARTDRQIGTALDILDGQYRARIFNLIKSGSLYEMDTKAKCEVTGKTVRLTRRFL